MVAGGLAPGIPVKRFDLLVALMRRIGPVHLEELRQQVWPDSEDLKKVRVTIYRLRRDLAAVRSVRIEMGRECYDLVV